MRAGLSESPVIEAPERDAWGGADGIAPGALLATLLPQRELGQVLVDAIVKNRNGPLAESLLCRAGVMMPPTPEEALALLAVLLVRSVHSDPSRRVPIDVVRQLGEQGSKLLPLLRDALTNGKRATAAETKTALAQLENVIPMPERGRVLGALAPKPQAAAARDTFKAPASKPGTAVMVVSPARLDALKKVTIANLVDATTYGSAPLLQAANAALGPPATRLGELLAAEGVQPDSPRDLRAALVKVLWGFRDPLNAPAIAWQRLLAEAGDSARGILA